MRRPILALAMLCGACAPSAAPVDAGSDAGAPFDAGSPTADAGAPDAGPEVCRAADAGTLAWDAGVAVLALGGQTIGSLLDPPGGCYRTDFDVPFWVDLDRPATLDATLVPTKFSPFLAVHRGCSGPNVACGSTALQGVALTPGGYLVVVSSHALGSGPDVGRFALSLTFTSDGG